MKLFKLFITAVPQPLHKYFQPASHKVATASTHRKPIPVIDWLIDYYLLDLWILLLLLFIYLHLQSLGAPEFLLTSRKPSIRLTAPTHKVSFISNFVKITTAKSFSLFYDTDDNIYCLYFCNKIQHVETICWFYADALISRTRTIYNEALTCVTERRLQ